MSRLEPRSHAHRMSPACWGHGLLLMLAAASTSCTQTVGDPPVPSAYQVSMRIDVNDHPSREQQVTVRPGTTTELRFTDLSEPLVVHLTVSPAGWPNDVEFKSSIQGRVLQFEWSEAQKLGGTAELDVSAGEPPVRYRFLLTPAAASSAAPLAAPSAAKTAATAALGVLENPNPSAP